MTSLTETDAAPSGEQHDAHVQAMLDVCWAIFMKSPEARTVLCEFSERAGDEITLEELEEELARRWASRN